MEKNIVGSNVYTYGSSKRTFKRTAYNKAGKWLPRFSSNKKNMEMRNKEIIRDGKKNWRGFYTTNANATSFRSH